MTGLIYVILIAIWAVVLVPRFLRHHDESRRRKETERLEAALAPQARQEHAADDHRAGSWAEYVRSLTTTHTTPLVGQLRSPRSRQARRRRTIVLILSASVTVSVLGAVTAILPGFIAVGTALLLGAYVTAMFTQMRRSDVGAGSQTHPAGESAQNHAGADGWQRSSSDGVRVVSADPGAAESSWEPRQTTLPTYVSKPKASRIPRRIDLTRAGWTGADMVEEARRRQVSPDQQQRLDDELAAVSPDEADAVEEYAYPETVDGEYYRRAVNE